MAPAQPEVLTTTGRIKGCVEDGNAVFRGIPFAKPPLGQRRFLAPETPDPWDGVREATAFGPQCPQAPPAGISEGRGISSVVPADTTGEWLTVNVWTPDTHAGTLPVMVWIHGGAYLFGEGGRGYDGAPFA